MKELRYHPVTTAHMCVIFRVVPRVFAIVVHMMLKPWSTTTRGLKPCVALSHVWFKAMRGKATRGLKPPVSP